MQFKKLTLQHLDINYFQNAEGTNRLPDYTPFWVTGKGEKSKTIRAVNSLEGIGDRLRAAAFAEIQAFYGFIWAAEKFKNQIPKSLYVEWRGLAMAEERHLGWLLYRMQTLNVLPEERPVKNFLWDSFMKCNEPAHFAHFMANAEDRGKQAGHGFYQQLKESDPETALIFETIAHEETEHIALTYRYFPDYVATNYLPVLPKPPAPRLV